MTLTKVSFHASVMYITEIALIFAIFYIFGANVSPDVNEAHYIGKAIHFWQPESIPNDSFLDSKDSHWLFYVAFGWLSFFMTPLQIAVTGRFLAWTLLAWGWFRLSRAICPIPWSAPLSALAFATYLEYGNMAGEWVIGGIEGKSLAFPFVFFGLAAMIKKEWGRTWILLGIAAAFHVLVGGWSVLLAMFVGVCERMTEKTTEKIHTQMSLLQTFEKRCHVSFATWSALIAGGIIALLGLIPVILLDFGVSKEIVSQAHQIYVFERLPHHLVFTSFTAERIVRFFVLVTIWTLFCRLSRFGSAGFRLDLFVTGSLVLAFIGIAATFVFAENRPIAAEILRFYWFRLSDVAVPLGISLGLLPRLFAVQKNRPILSRCKNATLLIVIPCLFFIPLVISRIHYYPYSRIEPSSAQEWREACKWIAESTPKDAAFWVPRDGATFKWFANRADIGVWKNIPQDAAGIVKWKATMTDLFSYLDENGERRWVRFPVERISQMSQEERLNLIEKYRFQYILTIKSPAPPSFPVVYENDAYRIECVQKK
ncbi:MAG: DUF6798 domain-containing protein [Thermoguttaceae bacterium]